MNPYARTLEAKRKHVLAPYVVVDDGRVSGKPEIALIRNCDVAEIAHIVRALSIFSGNSADAAVQNCNVRLCGKKLTNSLGDGAMVQPTGETASPIAPELLADMTKRVKSFHQETRNQRKRRRRAARMK